MACGLSTTTATYGVIDDGPSQHDGRTCTGLTRGSNCHTRLLEFRAPDDQLHPHMSFDGVWPANHPAPPAAGILPPFHTFCKNFGGAGTAKRDLTSPTAAERSAKRPRHGSEGMSDAATTTPPDCSRHAVQPSPGAGFSPQPVVDSQEGANEDKSCAEQEPILSAPELETIRCAPGSSSTPAHVEVDTSPTNNPPIFSTMPLQPTQLGVPESPASPVREVDDDSDPGYFGDDDSSTCSVDVEKYTEKHSVKLNGRTYYSRGEELSNLPIDSGEGNRQKLEHIIITALLDGKLSLTNTMDKKWDILNVGSGAGHWGIEVGEDNPAATVLGIDKRLMWPGFLPPNVRYQVDDYEEQGWNLRMEFDFAFCRGLEGQIKNWPQVLGEIYKALKPGGRLEIQAMMPKPRPDHNSSSLPEHPISRLMSLFDKACEKNGCVLDVMPELEGWLKAAGFKKDSIHGVSFKLPLRVPENHQLEMVSEAFRYEFLSLAEAIAAAPLGTILEMSPAAVGKLMAEVERAVEKDEEKPVYFAYVVFTAEKDAQ